MDEIHVDDFADLLEDLECGDLVIKDSGRLGLDIWMRGMQNAEGYRLCFLNQKSCEALAEWLIAKNVKEKK